MKLPLLMATLFLTALLAFAVGNAAAADSRSELTTADRIAQVGAVPQIYWIDAGTIRRASADGSGAIEDLITSGQPTSLTLDLAAGRLYWTDTAAGKIKWADLNDLGNHYDLYSLGSPTSLVLDPINSELYWTDRVPGSIWSANADGSSSTPELLVLEGEPTSLALDLGSQDMYWTDGATGKIRRAKMNRSILDPIDDLATDLVWPDNLALDLAQGQMYWTEWSPGRVRRANLTGAVASSIENLVDFTSGLPTGLTLDLPGDKMYWTDGVNQTIQSSELTGASFAVTDVFSAADGLNAPEGIVVPAALAGPTVLRSAPQLYWVDEEAQKVQRTGADDYRTVLDQLTSEHGLNMPGSIALDPIAGKMYWTDDGTEGESDGRIRRADLDGSNVEDLVSGLADPVGIALDLRAGRLYWADRHEGAIYRGALRDISPSGLLLNRESLVANLDRPYQIALDSANGHMYWTERGEGASKIRRADRDGGNVTDLAFGSVAPLNPFGLALDPVAGKMYWTERGTGSDGGDWIARADRDGQNGEIVVTSAYHSLSGIAVDVNDGKIYWTDETTGTIRRTDPADANRVVETVVSGLSAPEGVAVAGPYLSSTRLALTALYRATGGPQGAWEESENWLSDAPLGQWHGITTLDDLGENTTDLVGLDLSDNGLTGELPGTLGTLDHLQWLDLSDNQLTGDIPPELGSLGALIILDLSGNGLSGEVPRALGEGLNLRELNLSNNSLTQLPSDFDGLFINLESLDLGHNGLRGTIPEGLGGLTKLRVLLLNDQNYFREFTYADTSVAGSALAAELQKDENYLHGSIPPGLRGLVNLEVLDLSNNRLSAGIIPLGSLPNLRAMDLSNNKLNGNVSVRAGTANSNPKLRLVNLSSNQLTGTIPSSLGSHANYRQLENLNLSDNQLGGEIPETFQSLSDLMILNLSSNQLNGAIPQGLGSLANLRGLYIGHNQFSGPIPTQLGNLSSLRTLRIEGNQELEDDPSACIPNRLRGQLRGYWHFFDPISNFGALTFCDEAALPLAPPQAPDDVDRAALVALYEATDGENWSNSEYNNWGSNRPIGEWSGVTLNNDGRVVGLELVENGLDGQLPAELGDLDELEELTISWNRELSTEIPAELGNLTNLKVLDLSVNDLYGKIPSSLHQLDHLEVLRLDNNRLDSISLSTRLQTTGLYRIFSSGTLRNLAVLRLDHNELSGDIPAAIGQLPNLVVLRLNDNRFSGEIPEGLGNLDSLHVVTLDNNSLAPTIPSGLADRAASGELWLIWDEPGPSIWSRITSAGARLLGWGANIGSAAFDSALAAFDVVTNVHIDFHGMVEALTDKTSATIDWASDLPDLIPLPEVGPRTTAINFIADNLDNFALFSTIVNEHIDASLRGGEVDEGEIAEAVFKWIDAETDNVYTVINGLKGCSGHLSLTNNLSCAEDFAENWECLVRGEGSVQCLRDNF